MIALLATLGALYLLLTLLVAIVLRLVLRGRNCISWARAEIRAGRAVAVVIRRSRHKPYPFHGLFRPLNRRLRPF